MIETDCLPILRMMRCCMIPEVEILRWITNVKSLNPKVPYISGKDNVLTDMHVQINEQ